MVARKLPLMAKRKAARYVSAECHLADLNGYFAFRPIPFGLSSWNHDCPVFGGHRSRSLSHWSRGAMEQINNLPIRYLREIVIKLTNPKESLGHEYAD